MDRREQERLSGLFFDAAAAIITHLEAAGDPGAALRHARHASAWTGSARKDTPISLAK
jgi:hypothetical protein